MCYFCTYMEKDSNWRKFLSLFFALLLISCGAGNKERLAHEECEAVCGHSSTQLAVADSCFRVGDFDSALLYAEHSLSSLAVCRNAVNDSILYATKAHERLSVIYAALGQKENSDYHRNAYLDGLHELRQDIQTQNNIDTLQEETDMLNLVIFIIICGALILVAVAVFVWRRRNTSIQRELEGETYLYKKHIEDKKRDTVVKLTSLSIVNGITPYLERVVNAVDKLRQGLDEDKANNIERLTYIRELIDKINEYNDIVTHWVMMKHGAVKLNVENFSLRTMFDTLAKNKTSFSTKDITLNILPTEAVVKADMALTFFMINTLLDNARKYTGKGGTVTLGAEDGEGFVEISVNDTGCGLSEGDIARILHDKVYDSSKIGDADNNPELKRNKGVGFGLMSCKGIIDKYRKTSHLFDVCRFNITSRLGEGSTFSFRLPKGVAKAMTAVFLALSSVGASAIPVTDSLVVEASYYADATYYCNLKADYEDALLFADSAIIVLGEHYDSVNPDSLLVPIILDLRNEISIAALALRKWDLYEANNKAYAVLYHQVSADSALEEKCAILEEDNKTKRSVIFVSIISLCIAVVLGVIQMKLSSKKSVRDFFYRLRAKLNPHTKIVMQAEEKRRAKYEENTIHVHNQVLDNCLSTIKHETMYYPSRIRQLVDKTLAGADTGIRSEDVDKMYELVAYYKEIFSLLYRYASRQLENVVFKRHAISVKALADYAETIFGRMSRKQGSYLTLHIERPDGETSLIGDEHLLQYLLYNLITMSYDNPQQGKLGLDFSQSEEFLTITFTDNRGIYTTEQLEACFYPDFLTGKDETSAKPCVHFLLCKQIVREHDERASRRGCRIYAEPLEQGYSMTVRMGIR